MAYNDTRRRSILQELNDYVPLRSKEELIESRGNHIISSAINLLRLVYESYSPEEAEQIEKRFISSIRGKDSRRFERAIQKMREEK